MSELQLIEAALKRVARRRRWERAWRGFWQGLLAGGLVWLLVFALYKVFPLPSWALNDAAITAAVLVLTGFILATLKKCSLLETARWVDARNRLQERLSTALEVGGSSVTEQWKALVLHDAAQHLTEVNPRQLAPIRWTRASR